MKRCLLIIIICAACVNAYATRPFPPKVFANDGFAFVVGFAWPDQDGNVLLIRTMRETALFSLDDLGFRPFEDWTTAGHRWYQNAIGYVTTLEIKDDNVGSMVRAFYFRHRDGKETAIDLRTMQFIDLKTVQDRETLDNKSVSVAAGLLKSHDPRDRQTSAIHLGQLRSRQHLEELIALLDDNASLTRGSSGKMETIYYVREAAEEAIKLIQEEDEDDLSFQGTF